MDSLYYEIQKRADPDWATRRNDHHIPSSYGFARRLLISYPLADRDVVLPAVLLHDVGWKMLSEEKQRDAFGPTVKDSEAQRLHETEGVRIALEILTELDYDPEKTRQILAIIDGHDTREQALSLNDQLVKDADKLWRFTPYCVYLGHRRFGFELKEYMAWLDGRIPEWFWTPEARAMARESLDQAKRELLHPDGTASNKVITGPDESSGPGGSP